MVDLNLYPPKSKEEYENGWMPLHWVAKSGQLKVFKSHSTESNSLNPRDNFGTTPLHIAAKNGHLQVCEIILQEVAVTVIQDGDYTAVILI